MNGRIGTDSLTCSLHKSQIKEMCDCKLVLSFFGVMDEQNEIACSFGKYWILQLQMVLNFDECMNEWMNEWIPLGRE